MTDTPHRTGYMRAIEDAATAANRDIRTWLTEFIHLWAPPTDPRLHTKEQTTMAAIPTDPHYTISRAGTITNTRTGRVLKPWKRGKDRPLAVDLPSGRYNVRTLVANTYLGPRPEGHVITHLDGDPTNLHVDNLAYVTRSECMRDVHNRTRRTRNLSKGETAMTNTPNPGIERNVVPEFWNTPGIDNINAFGRLLYLAMHTWADDYGRGLLDPDGLNQHAFPYDNFSRYTIAKALAEIREVFPVTYYTVNGRDYYQIDDWTHTQAKPITPPAHPGLEHPTAAVIQ